MPDLRPSLATTAFKTFNRARVRGPAEVWGEWWSVFRQAVRSRDELLMLVRSTEGAELEAGTRSGLEVRRATTREARAYAAQIGTDSPKTFAGRLSDDTGCFLVLEDDAILHASWVTRTGAWAREIRAYICPPPGDAYVYESFTVSKARGRGVYPYALGHIVAEMGRSGVNNVWVAVEAGNQASRRAIAKAGFEVAYEISYRRDLGRFRTTGPSGPRASEAAKMLRGTVQTKQAKL